MENVKYHKFLPDETPKGSWKKEQKMNYCVEHNIAISTADMKSVIWDRLECYVNENIKPVIVSMVEAAGH